MKSMKGGCRFQPELAFILKLCQNVGKYVEVFVRALTYSRASTGFIMLLLMICYIDSGGNQVRACNSNFRLFLTLTGFQAAFQTCAKPMSAQHGPPYTRLPHFLMIVGKPNKHQVLFLNYPLLPLASTSSLYHSVCYLVL